MRSLEDDVLAAAKEMARRHRTSAGQLVTNEQIDQLRDEAGL